MPRQLILECVIDLPDDGKGFLDIMAKVRDPLHAFMLEAEGLGGKVKVEVYETRAKPPQGKKMGRPRKSGPMRIVEPPEPDAAA